MNMKESKPKIMKQYKYFFTSDSKKEAVGKIKAPTKNKAIKKAAARKKLNLEHFLELFSIEETTPIK